MTYIDHSATASRARTFLPGLKPEDLPDEEGWAVESVGLPTMALIWMPHGISIQQPTMGGTNHPPSMKHRLSIAFNRASSWTSDILRTAISLPRKTSKARQN